MKSRKARIWIEDHWLEIALSSIFLAEVVAWRMDVVSYEVVRSLCETAGRWLLAALIFSLLP